MEPLFLPAVIFLADAAVSADAAVTPAGNFLVPAVKHIMHRMEDSDAADSGNNCS